MERRLPRVGRRSVGSSDFGLLKRYTFCNQLKHVAFQQNIYGNHNLGPEKKKAKQQHKNQTKKKEKGKEQNNASVAEGQSRFGVGRAESPPSVVA